jgi:PAS domain S-box-containing protein
MSTDISAFESYRMMQEALQIYGFAVEASSSGITIADARLPDYPIVYINPAFEQMTGYSADEVLGRNLRFLQGDDRDQEGIQEVRAALHEGRQCNVTIRNYRRDGTLFWNEMLLSPVYNNEGELTYYIGIQNDVTRRVEAEQAMEESERRYRMVSELSFDYALCMRVEPDGRLEREWVTDAFTTITGYTPEESEARGGWATLTHPEDLPKVAATARELLTTGKAAPLEYRIITKSGETLHLLGKFQTVRDATGRVSHIYAIAHNVTQQKHLEAERQRADALRHELETEREVARLKQHLVSLISHEFRTPLTIMMSSAQILERYSDRLTHEQALTHIHTMMPQIHAMSEMLDNMLAVSKAEANMLPFNPMPLNPEKLARDVMQKFQLTDAGSHQFVFETGRIPAAFYADRWLLEHILTNLLSNAIKYSPPDSTVSLRLTSESDAVVFEVSDQGIGIPEADQDAIFDPFFRASNADGYKGTGLGLALVKTGVDMHGGSISVRSVANEGTRFTVRLPIL